MVKRVWKVTGFGLGFCVGWLTCFLVAFAQSKGVERSIAKMMEQNPIRATED